MTHSSNVENINENVLSNSVSNKLNSIIIGYDYNDSEYIKKKFENLIQECHEIKIPIIALISNFDIYTEEYSLFRVFDEIFVSNKEIDFKPLTDYLEKSELKFQKCIYIDNSLTHLNLAKEIGFNCIGYYGKKTIATTQGKKNDDVSSLKSGINFKEVTELSLENILETFKLIPSDYGPVHNFLNKDVTLPGNIKTSRREILKYVNFAFGSTCLYLLISRSKSMSYITPKSILNAFKNNQYKIITNDDNSRIDAFKRFINDFEENGKGKMIRSFPKDVNWLNAPPLTLERNLKGKMVILDFWTYCCINCIHILPDLAFLEKKFKNKAFTVIGIHSAKFDNEKDTENIRNAVIRYDINHPVFNDKDMVMWRDLGISSWPTLAVLTPKGELLFTIPGEGHRKDLEDIIEAGLEYYDEKNLLDNNPIPLSLEKDKSSVLIKSNLRYPGKIASDLINQRLFISDTNNHRIVILTLDGKFIDEVGGNGPKLLDGTFSECSFNRPQGLIYDELRDVVYVTDTENHALRKIDLRLKSVTTLCGNGYQGRDYRGGSTGRSQQLSSPWDVIINNDKTELYIAMAGQHQIWIYDIIKDVIKVFSGNGQERNKNGNNGINTSWAQPSGLSLSKNGNYVYVADSESSSLRLLDLNTGGSQLLTGGDPLFPENLFQFGDKDSASVRNPQALLQHPLAVLSNDTDYIYIADSYNHKIKRYDMTTGLVKTLFGSNAGYLDGKMAKFSEPGGLAPGLLDNLIYVADTNNSLIRLVDLKENDVMTLNIVGLPVPRIDPTTIENINEDDDSDVNQVIVSDEEIRTSETNIYINFNFDKGYNFTKGTTSTFIARIKGKSNETIKLIPNKGVIRNKNPNISLKCKIEALNNLDDVDKIEIKTIIYYCEEGEACLLDKERFEIPISKTKTKIMKEGDSEIVLNSLIRNRRIIPEEAKDFNF